VPCTPVTRPGPYLDVPTVRRGRLVLHPPFGGSLLVLVLGERELDHWSRNGAATLLKAPRRPKMAIRSYCDGPQLQTNFVPVGCVSRLSDRATRPDRPTRDPFALPQSNSVRQFVGSPARDCARSGWKATGS
jgi:hypothetical protein